MKVKKPILLIQDNFGGLDQNQGQNPIVHCRFVGFPPLFGAKNASKSLKMPMFPYKMDTLYMAYGMARINVVSNFAMLYRAALSITFIHRNHYPKGKNFSSSLHSCCNAQTDRTIKKKNC